MYILCDISIAFDFLLTIKLFLFDFVLIQIFFFGHVAHDNNHVINFLTFVLKSNIFEKQDVELKLRYSIKKNIIKD
jgi:hypothetical protein